MTEAKLKCPSCGTDVGLGDIECPNCGINLKSGESYATRVKHAKGKSMHPEHFTGPVFVIVLVASAVFLFAGLKWQETCEDAIFQRSDLFDYAVLQMQTADDLVAQGQLALREGDAESARQSFEKARGTTQELITWLASIDQQIHPDETVILTGEPKRNPRSRRLEPQYNKKVVKRMIVNLERKAARKLEQIPPA